MSFPIGVPGLLKTVKDGGVFVQSGFYLHCEDVAKGEDG